MIARAAYKSGVKLSDKSVQDDLKYSKPHQERLSHEE
jgi:multisubunit Na+/H+ antiporter MnhG subunit